MCQHKFNTNNVNKYFIIQYNIVISSSRGGAADEAIQRRAVCDRTLGLGLATRKPSDRRTLGEILGAVIRRRIGGDRLDTRHGWAAAARFDEPLDGGLLADDQRLDRAVVAVAHPAAEA